MKWKCIDCYAVFHAAVGRQANCPQCGSVNCFDCNVEPVDARSEGLLHRMQLVEEMPAELERMPVRCGETQRGAQHAASHCPESPAHRVAMPETEAILVHLFRSVRGGFWV